jgi:hypothetical protein
MDEALSKALRLLGQAGRDPFLVTKKPGSQPGSPPSTLYVDLRKVDFIEHDASAENGASNPLNLLILIGGKEVWIRVPPVEVESVIQRWQALRVLER